MNTVEGALVLSALTAVTGLIFTGFVTLNTAASAHHLARDAARAAALGEDPHTLVRNRNPEAQLHISTQKVGELEEVNVNIHLPAPLWDITATAITLKEPADTSEAA